MAAADAPPVPSTVAAAEGADAPAVEQKPPEPATQAPAAERAEGGEEKEGEDDNMDVLLLPENGASGQPEGTAAGGAATDAEGVQKRQRAKKVLNPRWTAELDEKLAAAVKEYGDAQWSKVAELVEGRSGKQCRERWKNHVCSEVKQGDWSPEEDARLVEVVGEVRLEHVTYVTYVTYVTARYASSMTSTHVTYATYVTSRSLASYTLAALNTVTPGLTPGASRTRTQQGRATQAH